MSGRRAPCVVVLALVLLVVAGDPAGAHGGPGVDTAPATNYRTRVRGVDPAVPGLLVRPIEGGDRVELVNETGEEVVVEGYAGEPYLRVGLRGVFENRSSPATYLNASAVTAGDVPDGVDADDPARWRRLSGGSTVRWHDHRAHWMGGTPEAVAAAPRDAHIIVPDFVVPVRVGGRRVEVQGDLTWVPGPSPWPWYALAAGLAVAVVALGRRRGVACAVVGLVVLSGIDAIGVWRATTEPVIAQLRDLVLLGPTWALAAVALVALARGRDRGPSLYGLALAGGSAALVLATVGLAGWATLGRSQVPVDLPGGLARLAVAGCLGLGLGVVATTGLALGLPDRPASAVFVAFFRSDRRRSTKNGLIDPGQLVEGS